MKSRRLLISSTAVLTPFLAGCDNTSASSPQTATSDQIPAKLNPHELYLKLRTTASKITPEIVQLSSDVPDDTVLAVLYEWRQDQDTVGTILIDASGTASLYMSNGFGVIGSGEYDRVNQAARFCIDRFSSYRHVFTPITGTIPFPDLGQTRITLVTKGGLQSHTEKTQSIMDPSHDLYELFQAKEMMLTLIREESERVEKERESDSEP
jgi:hypothetical protein